MSELEDLVKMAYGIQYQSGEAEEEGEEEDRDWWRDKCLNLRGEIIHYAETRAWVNIIYLTICSSRESLLTNYFVKEVANDRKKKNENLK